MRTAAIAGTVILLLAMTAAVAPAPVSVAAVRPPLRVCADPNNLPFSNRAGDGFENRLAALLARDLETTVAYTWWPQRRGFVRNTLEAARCDIVMGVPSRMNRVETTRPYYRSTYVFVSSRQRHLRLASLDDRRLRQLRVGVQLVGDDFANSPPAHALSARGIVGNVVGYSVLGDYSQPNPPARIVEAVARGEIDVALVWGPVAGYFASRQPVALEIVPISPQADSPSLPFTFDLSMAVRRGDDARLRMLDDFVARRRPEIDRLLAGYGVPRADAVVRTADTTTGGGD